MPDRHQTAASSTTNTDAAARLFFAARVRYLP